jgi:hypothetical protein
MSPADLARWRHQWAAMDELERPRLAQRTDSEDMRALAALLFGAKRLGWDADLRVGEDEECVDGGSR